MVASWVKETTWAVRDQLRGAGLFVSTSGFSLEGKPFRDPHQCRFALDLCQDRASMDAPSYPPLDPNSEEGRLQRAYHELGQKLKTGEQAHRVWHSLSEWMVDEHTRHINGRPWQKVFEPKRISPPGGYHTPKVVAATMSAFYSNVGLEQTLGIPMLQTEVTAHAILYEVIRYKVSIYYVADAFIRAVAATDLPRDFALHDLHWPMPGMVLGFPIKFMLEYLGRDVCYVYAADLKEGAS
jgi:hypothetical protein